MKRLSLLIIGRTIGLALGLLATPGIAWSQSITAAEDGTGTVVNSAAGNSEQYDISGGSQAGANLFHSFEQMGLSEGEIANFLSNPDVENILGRVTGGDASFIDGLLQVSGSGANLFLMNPAGVIFGENAQLNVPADFSVTTANAIGIDQNWFQSLGTNDYAALTGMPESFAFTSESPGAIVNAGNLSVNEGQRIQLLGGLVVNTGTLSTPGGEITIEAVPGEGLVTVTPEGNLLSLGLPVETTLAINGGQLSSEPQALSQLLSRAEAGSATGISVDGNVVRLTRADTVIPTDAGVAIASGTLDVSNSDAGVGGRVDVLGERVGLVDALVEASGAEGGGIVRVGGNYRGEGSLPNAEQTYVDSNSVIDVNADQLGNGGRSILWSDESTKFYGTINATGGNDAGNGGFVEVSSRDSLVFLGTVAVEAAQGHGGTLLLDPKIIRIIDIADGDGTLDGQLTPGSDSEILAGGSDDEGSDARENTISVAQLEAFRSNSNIVIEAEDGITIGPIADGSLNFPSADETPQSNINVTFQANSNEDELGDFLVEDEQGRRASILNESGSIKILGVNVTTGDIRAVDGDIDIVSTGNIVTRNLSVDRMNSGDGVGTVFLQALEGNIAIETIDASSSRAGVSFNRNPIYIEAGGFFRATGSFISDRDRDSIFYERVSLVAPRVDNPIIIKHGSDSFNIGPEVRLEENRIVRFTTFEFDGDCSNVCFESITEIAPISLEVPPGISIEEAIEDVEEGRRSLIDLDGNNVNPGRVIAVSSPGIPLHENGSFTSGGISLFQSDISITASQRNNVLSGAGIVESDGIRITSTGELVDPGDSSSSESNSNGDNSFMDNSGTENFIADNQLMASKCSADDESEPAEVGMSQLTLRNSDVVFCFTDRFESSILKISEDLLEQ